MRHTYNLAAMQAWMRDMRQWQYPYPTRFLTRTALQWSYVPARNRTN